MPPYASETIYVRKCPVCGQKPRISVCPINHGFECEIKCKPFLRKKHLSVRVYRNREARAVSNAIDEWTYACAHYRPKK